MKLYNDAARFYDSLSFGTPGDVKFYVKEAKKARGKVLEIACGTGRIYLPLLKASVDAYGLDNSKGMLRILEQKAENQNLKPKVKCADMRSFSYPFKFDQILIPYRAFLHMETREDQKACLKNAYKHLKKGGKLILNFFDPVPDVISKKRFKWPKRKFIDSATGKEFGVINESYYDMPNQRIRSYFSVKSKSKLVPKKRIEIHLCYIFPREFMNLLELCGFSKWELYGGFNYRPYSKNGQELVWVAYK